MFRNFKMVSRVVFGRGCFNQLDDILMEKRKDSKSIMAFLVDDVFLNTPLPDRIPLRGQDLLLWVNVHDEPKTAYVDELTRRIRSDLTPHSSPLPAVQISVLSISFGVPP